MEMVPIEDLLPEVLRFAPNAPGIVAERALREAAREFCQRTLLWREHDTLTIAMPACEGLITSQDAAIWRIESARFGGQPVEPTTVAWLDENYPDWQSSTDVADSPRYVTQLRPNTISVVPKATGDIALTLILQPARLAINLPRFLLDEHGEDIGKGAAAKVMLLPNASIGNPQHGADLRAEFQRRVDVLSTKTQRGQQGARVRSPGRYF